LPDNHFAVYPVMPGLLIIEAMAQTAAALDVPYLGRPRSRQLVYFMTSTTSGSAAGGVARRRVAVALHNDLAAAAYLEIQLRRVRSAGIRSP